MYNPWVYNVGAGDIWLGLTTPAMVLPVSRVVAHGFAASSQVVMYRPKSVTFAHCGGVVQGARNKEHVEGGGGMEAGQYRPSAMCVGRCMSNDKVWMCNT